MKVICFSSFTYSYLNRARVLFESVRRYHPDWRLVALVTDRPPPGLVFSPQSETFDELVMADELGIGSLPAWLFRHDVVEACTAVKGPFLRMACDRDVDAVIYLDPDTCLFSELTPILELLEDHDIVLTPHQLEPDDEPMAIGDNEMGSLKTGIFNLGFLAVRTSAEGRRFAKWWSDRLLSYCFNDIPNGLFVDQRWCDHAPGFFGGVHVLRDPGYNVASWNLSRRRLTIGTDGSATINGSPLRFWHFTKLGAMADAMTERYARDNFEVYELWNWYRGQVSRNTSAQIPAKWWAYGQYDDGTAIAREHRVLYRQRPGLQASFPNPFEASSLLAYLVSEGLAERSAA